ncbi:MAG: ArnT family glycosyltransferase [Chthoniobacterales bacterium]
MNADALLASRRIHWLVFALALLIFATSNLPWQLEDYDQAKQAFTSFEAIEQGHWLFQHTPNAAIATKPPLIGWTSAAVFAITRSWEIAWRFPSFIAATALLLLIRRAAAVSFGPAASLVAASAFGFNLLTPRLATLARTDMPLALVIFAIGAQIWGKVRDGESWTARDRLIAFALLAAAMLVKGPIVYAFLLPGIVCCRLAWQRNVWCGWWPWLASLAVFIVWLGMGIWRVPEFLELVVIREFGGRFEGTHAAQPLYFYIPHLLGKFAPWSLLLIGFAIALRRTRMARETLWLLAWSVGGLIVMSLIPSKRVDRIFPVVPPLCLLIGAQFNQLKQMRFARVMTLIALGISLIAVPAYCATKIATGYRHHRDAYVQFAHRVLAAASPPVAIIGGEDEGLLLYLRKAEFTQPADAIAKWKRGEINAIVAPEDAIPKLMERLADAMQSSIGISGPAGNHGTRYALIVRR